MNEIGAIESGRKPPLSWRNEERAPLSWSREAAAPLSWRQDDPIHSSGHSMSQMSVPFKERKEEVHKIQEIPKIRELSEIHAVWQTKLIKPQMQLL